MAINERSVKRFLETLKRHIEESIENPELESTEITGNPHGIIGELMVQSKHWTLAIKVAQEGTTETLKASVSINSCCSQRSYALTLLFLIDQVELFNSKNHSA